MPDIKLDFKLKLKDGTEEHQSIRVELKDEVDPEAVCMRVLSQYATIGMLKKDGNKFILITAGAIERAEVELPSVLLANDAEIKSSNNLIL